MGSAPSDLLKEYRMQHFQFALLAPNRGAGALIANDLGRSDEATAARVRLARSQPCGIVRLA